MSSRRATVFGHALRRFFEEYLAHLGGVSTHTVKSYRDAACCSCVSRGPMPAADRAARHRRPRPRPGDEVPRSPRSPRGQRRRDAQRPARGSAHVRALPRCGTPRDPGDASGRARHLLQARTSRRCWRASTAQRLAGEGTKRCSRWAGAAFGGHLDVVESSGTCELRSRDRARRSDRRRRRFS